MFAWGSGRPFAEYVSNQTPTTSRMARSLLLSLTTHRMRIWACEKFTSDLWLSVVFEKCTAVTHYISAINNLVYIVWPQYGKNVTINESSNSCPWGTSKDVIPGVENRPCFDLTCHLAVLLIGANDNHLLA